MPLIVRVDLLTYSFIITTLLLIYIFKNYNLTERSTYLFICVLISTSIVIVFEGLTWVFDGVDTPFGVFMNYFTNSALTITETIPGLFWIIYFDYKIIKNYTDLKRRMKFYIIPGLIVTVLTFISLPTGFLFTIGPGNIYSRGGGVYVCAAIFVIQYIIAFRVALYSRKNFDSDIVITIASFFILPVIGMFLQLAFYGVTFIWPLFALVNLIAFIMLEKDVMLRDPLTGIYTRGVFEQKIISYINRGLSFNLIMIDLDKFKSINDNFGHAEGDLALQEVVSMVNSEKRDSDLFCRYGGDEFMLLLKSESKSTGNLFIKRINEKLKFRNLRSNKLYRIEMSIGHVFVSRNSHFNITQILEEVDARMYLDKAKANSFK